MERSFEAWRSGLVRGVAVALVACSASAFAQLGSLRQGVDYTLVEPAQPATVSDGRVEVIEFFGYWCPACNAFEPTMRDWAGRHAATDRVLYVPLPTHFRADQTNLQKLYYALDTLGVEKELRPKVFAAIHANRSLPETADVDALANWAQANGVDRKRFVDVFTSFAVSSKVARANQAVNAYRVTSLPSLAIDGKYLLLIDARTIGNADAVLARTRARS